MVSSWVFPLVAQLSPTYKGKIQTLTGATTNHLVVAAAYTAYAATVTQNSANKQLGRIGRVASARAAGARAAGARAVDAPAAARFLAAGMPTP